MDAIEHGFPRAVGGDSEMAANVEDVCVRSKRKSVAKERYMDEVPWCVECWARFGKAGIQVQTKRRVI